MTDGGDTTGRNAQGRFTAGNPGGPGGRGSHSAQLRRAAEEAVTPEHLATLMRKTLRMGLEGNLAAARLVFERTCGRAAEAPAEAVAIGIDLPRMHTAADCNLAIERLAEAITKGVCDLNAARVMIDVILARLKAIELNDLETRLAELEKTASTIDPNGSRHTRSA